VAQLDFHAISSFTVSWEEWRNLDPRCVKYLQQIYCNKTFDGGHSGLGTFDDGVEESSSELSASMIKMMNAHGINTVGRAANC
jgi:hypothetical protein